MTNDINEKDRSHSGTVKLMLVVTLAFVAAIVFRRSAGILAMTPLSLIMCAVAAFVGVGVLTKCAVFGVTVFAVNTIENDDISVTLLFTALCLLAVFVLSIAASQIKKGKKYGYAVMIIGAVICFSLGLIFVGNPITALNAKNRITEYTNTKYPESENAYLGNFEYSDIYYNYNTKAYTITAVSDKYPTEAAAITLGGNLLRDGFESLMEEKLGEPYILEIKEILRNRFPNDSFSVNLDGFALLPEENAFSSSNGELYQNIRYEIVLGGVQTADQMRERVNDYVKALDESGIGYAGLTFKSGIGNWIRRYVYIDPNHVKGDMSFDIKYVNKDTSNDFNRYLDSFTFQ